MIHPQLLFNIQNVTNVSLGDNFKTWVHKNERTFHNICEVEVIFFCIPFSAISHRFSSVCVEIAAKNLKKFLWKSWPCTRRCGYMGTAEQHNNFTSSVLLRALLVFYDMCSVTHYDEIEVRVVCKSALYNNFEVTRIMFEDVESFVGVRFIKKEALFFLVPLEFRERLAQL